MCLNRGSGMQPAACCLNGTFIGSRAGHATLQHTVPTAPHCACPCRPAAVCSTWTDACKTNGNTETCDYGALMGRMLQGTACYDYHCRGRYVSKNAIQDL